MRFADALPEAADLIDAATGSMPNLPLTTGSIDGFARFNEFGFNQLHLDADWTMEAAVSDIEGPSFNGALDVLAFHGDGEDAPCDAGAGDNGFNVSISAYDVSAKVLGTNTIFDTVELNFTLSESEGATAYLPIGIGGGISLTEPTDYQSFTLYQFEFDASIGQSEVYLGVGGLGAFDGSEMGLNVFLGRTCNDQNVSNIDSAVSSILPFSGEPFLGVYLRGELTAPFITAGCALDVSFRGSAGAWITAEPIPSVGGIIGGGTLGSIACLGSVRGQLDTLASVDSNGDVYFSGQAFAVGGAGFDCDRGTWTSAGRSRGDDWCGTADISANVRYQNKKWHADVDRPSGIH